MDYVLEHPVQAMLESFRKKFTETRACIQYQRRLIEDHSYGGEKTGHQQRDEPGADFQRVRRGADDRHGDGIQREDGYQVEDPLHQQGNGNTADRFREPV